MSKPLPVSPLRRHQPLAEAGVTITTQAIDKLFACWAGALEEPTPKNVHALRVALRQVRVAAHIFRNFDADGKLEAIRRALKHLASKVGRQRDLDVAIDDLVRPLQDGDLAGDVTALLAALESMRDDQRSATLTSLDDADAQALRRQLETMPRLVHSLIGAADIEADPHPDVGKFARKLLKKHWRALAVDAEKLNDMEPGRLHEMRKSVKKLRYAFGHFAVLWDTREYRAFASRLSRMQQILGTCNDVEAAKSLAETWRTENLHPELHFTLGCVLGVHSERAANARRKLDKQWKKLAATAVAQDFAER